MFTISSGQGAICWKILSVLLKCPAALSVAPAARVGFVRAHWVCDNANSFTLGLYKDASSMGNTDVSPKVR